MRYCDFRNAKVGDKVWSYRDGWLTIRSISCPASLEYPIETIDSSGLTSSFSIGGKKNRGDLNPILFWNKFEIPDEAFEKPLPKLEIDTLVWVWDDYKDEKVLRFFSHFDECGSIYTFDDGRDSSYNPNYNPDITTSWNNWELYEPKKKD